MQARRALTRSAVRRFLRRSTSASFAIHAVNARARLSGKSQLVGRWLILVRNDTGPPTRGVGGGGARGCGSRPGIPAGRQRRRRDILFRRTHRGSLWITLWILWIS